MGRETAPFGSAGSVVGPLVRDIPHDIPDLVPAYPTSVVHSAEPHSALHCIAHRTRQRCINTGHELGRCLSE
eukprot:895530-Rhodomonas_salina.1